MNFENFIFLFAIILYFIGIFLSFPRRLRRRRWFLNEYSNYNSSRTDGFIENLVENNAQKKEKEKRRILALDKAKSFLKPYNDIWGIQVLSNVYCSVVFKSEKKHYSFLVTSKRQNKQEPIRCFKANFFGSDDDVNELFDSLCYNFSFNTTIDQVYNVFNTSKFLIDDSCYKTPVTQIENKAKTKQKPLYTEVEDDFEKIDINNATEAELTALPGINIVLAKKIVLFRNSVRPYTSVNDFFTNNKIKKHFQKILINKIVVNQVIINKKVSNERILDI